MNRLITAVALLVSVSSFAAAPQVKDGVLVDERGMTLYVFDGKGAPDAKSCEGDCSTNFPPALAEPEDKATESFSLLPSGSNGEPQWAYKGKPLYHGAMDKKPGDTHGDGLNTVWHAVRPR